MNRPEGGDQPPQDAAVLWMAHALQAVSFGVPRLQQVFVQAYQAHMGERALQSPIVPRRLQSGQAVSLGVPPGQQVFEQ